MTHCSGEGLWPGGGVCVDLIFVRTLSMGANDYNLSSGDRVCLHGKLTDPLTCDINPFHRLKIGTGVVHSLSVI